MKLSLFSLRNRFFIYLAVNAVALSTACSNKPTKGSRNLIPENGLIISNQPLPIPNQDSEKLDWPDGRTSRIINWNGTRYFKVKGVVAPSSYELRINETGPMTLDSGKSQLEQDIKVSIKEIERLSGGKLLAVKIVPETGFYSAWIPYDDTTWNRLQKINELPIALTMEPVKYDEVSLNKIEELSSRSFPALTSDPRTPDSLSGLRSIGVTNEFLDELEQELGARPSGKTTKIGIVDSGITFSHPTFLGKDGRNRIRFMKDATPQGKVYFTTKASLNLRQPTDAEAEESQTPKQNLLVVVQGTAHFSPLSILPAADGPFLQNLPKDLQLILPAELKSKIENGSGVQLGLLAENAFNEGSKKVFDLNGNKNPNDVYAILLTGPSQSNALASSFDQSAYQAYVSMEPAGTFDGKSLSLKSKTLSFAKASGLHDFNYSGETQQSFAERFGITLKPTNLPAQTEEKRIAAIELAIVGYTAGSSHGTHVAGIAAGAATLGNDSPRSLARGVAPEADIYFYRVCGNSIGCGYYDEAIQELALEQKVDVINISIGADREENAGYDTTSLIIDRLTQLTGTTFFIAAGNSGTGLQTINSPAPRFAITVGATASRSMMNFLGQISFPSAHNDDADDSIILPESSRGPLANAGFKPDLVAPGIALSAVGFNVLSGRSGSGILQGTSMAAPVATGAYALLLDMARMYNRKHPEGTLPTDYQSLRKALLGSAKPFDITAVNLQTKESTRGHYTWVDQGLGLVNVPGAWTQLKLLARSQNPTGVVINNARIEPVYQVRTITTSRYGTVYDGRKNNGSASTNTAMGSTDSPGLWGGGLWLDNRSTRSLYAIGIARRLPDGSPLLKTSEDLGLAFNALASSKETFILRTEIHGSDVPWLKVNTLFQMNTSDANACDDLDNSDKLMLNGLGALDTVGSTAGTPESTLFVCVDRSLVASLKPGDHGAIIKAFRTNYDETKTENVPSFIIPIYLNVPNETLTGNKTLTVSNGQVRAFETDRHYVSVPAGVSALKVSLSVPKASKDAFGQALNCSGVTMDVYSASSVVRVPNFDPGKVWVNARACSGAGGTILDNDPINLVEQVVNPKPGLWEFHITGIDTYAISNYNLKIDYIKTGSKTPEVLLTKETMRSSTLNLDIKESTLPTLSFDEGRSTLSLNKAQRKSLEKITQGNQAIPVSSPEGSILRTFPASVSNATFLVNGLLPGIDLDLQIMECSLDGSVCALAAESAAPSGIESASWTVKADKAYQVVVKASNAPSATLAPFELTEILGLKAVATGSVKGKISDLNDSIEINLSIDPDNTKNQAFFGQDVFLSRKYEGVGSMVLSARDISLITIPVRVSL